MKKDKPLRVAPTHGIEHREIARLTAELGIEKLFGPSKHK